MYLLDTMALGFRMRQYAQLKVGFVMPPKVEISNPVSHVVLSVYPCICIFCLPSDAFVSRHFLDRKRLINEEVFVPRFASPLIVLGDFGSRADNYS